jgi:lysophospholipase L1-like esterase
MYGKENVIIILPMKRFNMNVRINPVTGLHLIDYVKVIKEYVDLYGLKYIDLFNDFFPEPPEEESEFFVDGLHPNDNGHKKIAEKICQFIKNDK